MLEWFIKATSILLVTTYLKEIYNEKHNKNSE